MNSLKSLPTILMYAKLLRCITLWFVLAGLGHAQTINWGSPVWSNLLDSTGATLASDSYAFELGTFGSFVPTDSNITSWSANWKAFDQASYSPAAGYFGSSATMNPTTGLSSNSIGGSTDFAGQSAYLFVRNTEGTNGAFSTSGEYLLARNASWTFPVLASSPNPGCCDNALPLEWSVSDLVTTNTCVAPVANVPTLQTGAVGSSGLVYASGSIFQWDLYANSNSSNDRGSAYTAVNVVGNVTIDPASVFKIVLHDGGDFTDAFWKTQHTWSDIFAASGITGSWSAAQIAVYSSSDCCNPLEVGSYGKFSYSGGSLTFTPVPEPTGAFIGLLLAGGLLRRHRSQAPPRTQALI